MDNKGLTIVEQFLICQSLINATTVQENFQCSELIEMVSELAQKFIDSD